MNSQPTFLFLTYLNLWVMTISKACKPDGFESHASLKLSFINIQGLRLNFVDFESLLESNSSDILALCEKNLDDSIDSGNFSVRGYLPLIWKYSSTHMHGLTVFAKERLPFALDLWFYFTQCLTSFSFINYLLHLCTWFFILFHPT